MVAKPGAVMRILQPGEDTKSAADVFDPKAPIPNIEAIYSLDENEPGSTAHNTIYFSSDISPVVENESYYAEDAQACVANGCSVSWVAMSFINGQDKAGPASAQVPDRDPPDGTVVVVNGSTPKAEMEQDYHDWYDQEHAGKLGLVPGWQCMRRYKLEKQYGDVETASFYGVNLYDEINGLGGPEWQSSVTDWTLRIRAQAAKPNVRRVWKLKEVKGG